MEKVRLTVTIPKNIYDALYEQAARDMRTVSNQLTYILEQRLISPVPTFAKPVYSPENPTGQNYTPTANSMPKRRKEII